MPLKWKKRWISDESFESAGVFDVLGDGKAHIVSGAFWYEGPDFRKKHEIGPVGKYGEYYDDFSTLPLDVNGDGRMDFVTGGWFGKTLLWKENPGKPGAPWPVHPIAEVGQIETARAWDVDGDGVAELIPNTPNTRDVKIFKLDTNEKGRGLGTFTSHTIHTFPEGEKQDHGLGCGDVAGNGRADILLRQGWLECPADPWRDRWVWHPDFPDPVWARASVPMLAVKLKGVDRGAVLTGSGHGYGLWWSEQRAERGERRWIHHPIDPENAQYHDLQWADVDGDGECELVTGKRHRAHCGHEAGEWDDAGIYYFKWNGESFSKQVIEYGPIGVGKGCGLQFALHDLFGTGRLDLIAPGKDGLVVYENLGP